MGMGIQQVVHGGGEKKKKKKWMGNFGGIYSRRGGRLRFGKEPHQQLVAQSTNPLNWQLQYRKGSYAVYLKSSFHHLFIQFLTRQNPVIFTFQETWSPPVSRTTTTTLSWQSRFAKAF